MKKVICTYGTPDYKKSLELLEKTAYEIGKVNQVYIYDRKWLESTNFYKNSKRCRYILNNKKGSGYWLWKPYIILETFKKLDKDDIVLYSDGGISIIDNLNILFEITAELSKDGRMVFKLPSVGVTHKAKMWTKRDCFVLTESDTQEYWDADMVNGALSLWEKNNKNIEFLNEWLNYLKDPRIITDDTNIFGINFIEFKGHRYDQSVLSLLVKRYNFELFRDPTQWGNEEIELFSNSSYGQLFHHHRNFKH